MPKKSLRISVDVFIRGVSCPGVMLKDRSDIFLEMCLFGRHSRTVSVSPLFPLHFVENFKFSKVFYNCQDPLKLSDHIQDESVMVELVQTSSVIKSGIVLATIDTNAKDFLFPYPSQVPVYSGNDRELLMTRTLHFDGISPKLEFSTTTTISEVITSAVDELEQKVRDISTLDQKIHKSPKKLTQKQNERRSTALSPDKLVWSSPDEEHLEESAWNRRSRSFSPTNIKGRGHTEPREGKPPFVVRKTGDGLFGVLRYESPTGQRHSKCSRSKWRKKNKGGTSGTTKRRPLSAFGDVDYSRQGDGSEISRHLELILDRLRRVERKNQRLQMNIRRSKFLEPTAGSLIPPFGCSSDPALSSLCYDTLCKDFEVKPWKCSKQLFYSLPNHHHFIKSQCSEKKDTELEALHKYDSGYDSSIKYSYASNTGTNNKSRKISGSWNDLVRPENSHFGNDYRVMSPECPSVSWLSENGQSSQLSQSSNSTTPIKTSNDVSPYEASTISYSKLSPKDFQNYFSAPDNALGQLKSSKVSGSHDTNYFAINTSEFAQLDPYTCIDKSALLKSDCFNKHAKTAEFNSSPRLEDHCDFPIDSPLYSTDHSPVSLVTNLSTVPMLKGESSCSASFSSISSFASLPVSLTNRDVAPQQTLSATAIDHVNNPHPLLFTSSNARKSSPLSRSRQQQECPEQEYDDEFPLEGYKEQESESTRTLLRRLAEVRSRSPSPIYRKSLRDRLDETPLSSLTKQIISNRVDRALDMTDMDWRRLALKYDLDALWPRDSDSDECIKRTGSRRSLFGDLKVGELMRGAQD